MQTTRGAAAIKAIIILVVVLLIGAAYLVLTRSVSEKPTGTIFVSSIQDLTHPLLQTYAVRVGAGSIDSVGSDENSVANLYSFANTGNSVVFMGTTLSRVQQVEDKKLAAVDLMQVYEGTTLDGTSVPLVTESKLITQDTSSNKTLPVISDNGSSVLYVSYAQASTSSPTLDPYAIHLVATTAATSTDKVLFHGTQPQWFSDNAFYYVGADGIRQYVISTATSTLVLPIAGQSNFKLSVSPNRHFLAFSDPDAKDVYIYSISANGLNLSLLKTISIYGFWTVWSPDSHFVAVQSADEVASGSATPAHPRLVIFDTTAFTQQPEIISLDPLLNESLFVTAWK